MSSEQSRMTSPSEPAHPNQPSTARRGMEILGRGGRRAAKTFVEAGRNRWFLGCGVMLLVFTAGYEVRFRHAVLHKKALPLKKSLGLLSHEKLTDRDQRYSYRLEGPAIQLEPEMVNQLGTDQYISWVLRLWDDSLGRQTDQVFQFFVTYYTGNPDQVPHVPEECHLGNGDQQAGNRLIYLTLEGLPEKDRQVPLQVLLFRREGSLGVGEQCEMVMYTFRVCDEWLAERERVRFTLGNPLSQYAYFSKVELSFPLPPGMPPEAVEKAIDGGKRFLSVALPVLVKEHWPDWPSDDGQARPEADGSKAASSQAGP
jgi:hypothetical protein